MEKPAISPLPIFLDKPRKFDLCSIFKKKKKNGIMKVYLKAFLDNGYVTLIVMVSQGIYICQSL